MLQVPESYVKEMATRQGITKAEWEALWLALSDRSGAEIAITLKISEAAVRKRLGECYRKFSIDHSGNKKLNHLKQRLLISYEASQTSKPKNNQSHQDWGEAVDDEDFCGRDEELQDLTKWIVGDDLAIHTTVQRCRLVAILGLGGVGKTSLAAKIANKLQDQFQYIIWRSLRNQPPLGDVLAELLRFLPASKDSRNLPDSENSHILRLIETLREHRCLIILDNVDSVLRSGEGKLYEVAGEYQEGWENYGYLFKKVGEADHQSCMLLTSREKPKEVAALEGKKLAVKVLQLSGLEPSEAREVLKDKGFTCSDSDLAELVKTYSGNPLALKIAATTIYDLFGNDVGAFLKQIDQETPIYGDIRTLLEQQFSRLSEIEKQVMYWLLSVQGEYVSLAKLKKDIPMPGALNQLLASPAANLLDAVESLVRRSLLRREPGSGRLRQRSVVRKYVAEQYNEQF